MGASGTSASEAAVDPTLRAAAALWSERCASCHGSAGRGDGDERPPGVRMPNFTDAAYSGTRSDVDMHVIIKNGRGMMPPFGDQLTDLGIDALIKHVRSLSGGSESP